MSRCDVCVLSDGEVDDLKRGVPLNHTLHAHVSKDEAFELSAGKRHGSEADFVGPHHIRLTVARHWRVVHESQVEPDFRLRVSTFQLVGVK